ncbi:MAG TPA: DUF1697 domain-containing protein [Candidatus Saccharimonadales bacterium]|nr:DUF1697 domain-containing protein [Candidatus Saccharimonadales bacterium]
MTYVALLRGINVGGNRKVEMAKLKLTFEQLGFSNVRTFIASGNVIFNTDSTNEAELTKQIEKAIEKDFGFSVSVLLRNLLSIEKLVKAIPNSWVNDKVTKCDVMFLWKEADSPAILKQLSSDPRIEDVKYYSGAVVWRIDRDKASKSRMLKVVGTTLHKQMTVRNPNTVRKIYDLMLEAKA